MKLSALVAACLFLVSTDCSAADARWQKINQSWISSSFLDVHTLARTREGNFRYNVKTVPLLPKAIDEEFSNDNIGFVILHGEMNCSTDSYKESSVDVFSTSGALLAVQPEQQVFKPVRPNTLEHNLSRFLCKRES